MYLVFYLSNIPCVHFELITVTSVKKTQTSVFTKQDRLCFTLVAQQFKLNFSCCASVWSVTSFESHLVCCICKTNKIGQRPDASTAIFTALLQTEALKWVLCATTYENVSTSVNQYSTKDETAARIARLALRRGVQSHGDASLSRSRSRERVGGNLGNEVGSVPSEVGGTKLSVFLTAPYKDLPRGTSFSVCCTYSTVILSSSPVQQWQGNVTSSPREAVTTTSST